MAFLEHLKEEPDFDRFCNNKTAGEDIVAWFLQKIISLELLAFSLENLQEMGVFGNRWETRDILNKTEKVNVKLDAREVSHNY